MSWTLPLSKVTCGVVSKLGTPRDGVRIAMRALCASCTSDVDAVVMRPLGRNDALVRICLECDGGDLRSGRYSFSGGRGQILSCGTIGGRTSPRPG